MAMLAERHHDWAGIFEGTTKEVDSKINELGLTETTE